MFKNIPGSHGVSISLNGELKSNDELFPDKDGKLTLTLHGKKQTVDLMWIAKIAHFEVNLPQSHAKYFSQIQFCNTNPTVTRSPSGIIMVFPKPLLIGDKYRIVPGFTDYAVSEDGVVINIAKWEIVEVQKNTAKYYPRVCIYNPDKSKPMGIYIHRLVALAWVSNSDWMLNCCVNHLDGDKLNFHRSNLEWVSYSQNNKHASDGGLLPFATPCIVKNVETGEIRRFESATSAFEYIGIPPRVLAICLNRGRKPLLNGKFELKRADDDTPWRTDYKLGQYTTTVQYPNGCVKHFHDLRDFRKELKVWNTSSIHDLLDKARSLYPDHKFSYIENYKTSSVQAKNVETGEIINAQSCSKLSQLTGVSKSRIVHYIRVGDDSTICNGYVFRVKSDEPWKSIVLHPSNKSKAIVAVCTDTLEKIRFKSLRNAATHFNADRSTLKMRVGKDKLLNGWRFEHDLHGEPITSARV